MKKSKYSSKLEKYSMHLFLGFMIFTAMLFLAGIWIHPENENFYKAVATFFVIGFANFLIWLPIILYRLLNRN